MLEVCREQEHIDDRERDHPQQRNRRETRPHDLRLGARRDPGARGGLSRRGASDQQKVGDRDQPPDAPQWQSVEHDLSVEQEESHHQDRNQWEHEDAQVPADHAGHDPEHFTQGKRTDHRQAGDRPAYQDQRPGDTKEVFLRGAFVEMFIDSDLCGKEQVASGSGTGTRCYGRYRIAAISVEWKCRARWRRLSVAGVFPLGATTRSRKRRSRHM